MFMPNSRRSVDYVNGDTPVQIRPARCVYLLVDCRAPEAVAVRRKFYRGLATVFGSDTDVARWLDRALRIDTRGRLRLVALGPADDLDEAQLQIGRSASANANVAVDDTRAAGAAVAATLAAGAAVDARAADTAVVNATADAAIAAIAAAAAVAAATAAADADTVAALLALAAAASSTAAAAAAVADTRTVEAVVAAADADVDDPRRRAAQFVRGFFPSEFLDRIRKHDADHVPIKTLGSFGARCRRSLWDPMWRLWSAIRHDENSQ